MLWTLNISASKNTGSDTIFSAVTFVESQGKLEDFRGTQWMLMHYKPCSMAITAQIQHY